MHSQTPCPLGTCSVELGPYVLGSWIGMLPGTYAYVNAGVAGRAVVMEGGEGAMSLDPVQVSSFLRVRPERTRTCCNARRVASCLLYTSDAADE
eukprot:1155809-Pelagomonas_calceolata.AAC.5